MTRPRDDNDEYRVMNARRRVLIGLLAIATAIAVVLMLVYPPGSSKRTRAAVPQCSASQPTDCVGGKADVIYVPLPAVRASAAASAATAR